LGDENTGNYLPLISTLSDDECSARKDQLVIVAGRNLAVQCIDSATEILSQLTATSSSLVCSLEARRAIVTYYRLDYLVSDFSTQAIQRYTDDNTRGFTGQILNVVVTWGEGTLKVRASPFVTVPNGIMQTKYHSQDGHPLGVESLPVGLTEPNLVLLEQTCLDELENKLVNQEFVSGVCCWRTADVSRSILETVYRYYDTMPVVGHPHSQPISH
jgi:hypothetical protein